MQYFEYTETRTAVQSTDGLVQSKVICLVLTGLLVHSLLSLSTSQNVKDGWTLPCFVLHFNVLSKASYHLSNIMKKSCLLTMEERNFISLVATVTMLHAPSVSDFVDLSP